jgi:hypothetical protein
VSENKEAEVEQPSESIATLDKDRSQAKNCMTAPTGRRLVGLVKR